MTTSRASGGFFEIPHAAVYATLTATIVISGACFIQAGAPAAPANLLFRYGAMYTWALERHEYWRLVAYGFLHINIVHLTTNMLCLVLWGGHLEKRVGSLYFLVIYLSAMMFGAIIGALIHSTTYITVGASGATSGLLGALMCLWILGKIDLQINFFAINIALNVAFSVSNPRIDWQIHLGGFAAGLIACALLDLVEKANFYLLRCKFPEFVKTNLFVLACASAVLLWGSRPAAVAAGSDLWALAAVLAAICFLVIKTIDIVLSVTKGLAITIILLAMLNAAVVLLGGVVFGSQLSAACAAHRATGPMAVESLIGASCSNPVLTAGIAAAAVLALTLLLYAQELYRGLHDVGFIGSSLRGERNRRQGI
jgi:membrane associated rhomboid family serine protease